MKEMTPAEGVALWRQAVTEMWSWLFVNAEVLEAARRLQQLELELLCQGIALPIDTLPEHQADLRRVMFRQLECETQIGD